MHDADSFPRSPGDDREGEMPEHEIDEDATQGGGIMSEGGTAVDRGTGSLEGTAQGEGPDHDRDPLDFTDVDAPTRDQEDDEGPAIRLGTG